MKTLALFIAQATYDPDQNKQKWEDLKEAANEASLLAEKLDASDYYENVLKDLLKGGNKTTIEQQLDEWLRNVPRDATVLFVWCGHGYFDGNKHYLVCHNTPKSAPINPFNAIETGAFGTLLGGCSARSVLLILDTCYSDAGAIDVAKTLAETLQLQAPSPGQQRAFTIIASAHSLEKAPETVFLKALNSALFDVNLGYDKREWSIRNQFIHTSDLSACTRILLPPDAPQPHYKVVEGDQQRFLPNPLYRSGLPDENVEEHQWRLSRSDGAEHFDLSARGIEIGARGSFFTGRTEIMQNLTHWLDTAEHGIRIVTGDPGAGKSAIMGRLATLSDPNYREIALQAGTFREGRDPAPRLNTFDAVIHAKGKTLDDCTQALARDLHAGNETANRITPQDLIETLRKKRQPLTVMFDALDEAASGEAEKIASQLVKSLSMLPRTRILVGSRRSLDGRVVPAGESRHDRLRAAFGSESIIDDLSDQTNSNNDIADYVSKRLRNSGLHQDTPQEAIEQAAVRVARRANGSFLYARIVSRTLQEERNLNGALPENAVEAFKQDLTVRFGREERKVDDLLSALAWAEGKGLTRSVWPLVANAIARRRQPYDRKDVAWVLDHAGWHIIEAEEEGYAVYRLAHQALTDHYRQQIDEGEAQKAIVAALTAERKGADWLEADDYIQRNLAAHAVKAGTLDTLIQDIGYLSIADPRRLLALPKTESLAAQPYADLYHRIGERLIGLSPRERMPLIHLGALMDEPDIAETLLPPVFNGWQGLWARVRKSSPHRMLVERKDIFFVSVAFGIIDGRPVIVSGSRDAALRLWDARSGAQIGAPLTGHIDRVISVAFGIIDGRPVIVSGSRDAALRLWDARSGAQIGAPLTGHTDSVNSVAFGIIDGRPVIVSGSRDDTIRLWDARSGAQIGAPLAGHIDRVISIAFGIIDGQPVIVSGGDDGTIRLWDARSGAQIADPMTGHIDRVTSIAFGIIDGRPVIVSGGNDRTLRLWDAQSEAQIGAPPTGHIDSVTSVAFGIIDGRPVIVSGSRDGTVRLWDTQSGAQIGVPLTGHTDSVNSVAFGIIDGRPVIVSGSRDAALRLWDARSGAQIGGALTGHTDSINSVAFGIIDGRPVIVSGGDGGTIRLWDARSGAQIADPMTGHIDRVTSIAFGIIDGRPVIVSGSRDDTIRLWDARSGAQIGGALTGYIDPINSVAFGIIDRRPVIVSGEDNGTVSLWDAQSGAQIADPMTGHEWRVNSVAFGIIDGQPVIVSGSDDHTLRLWNGSAEILNILIGEPILSICLTDRSQIIAGLTRGLIAIDLRKPDSIQND